MKDKILGKMDELRGRLTGNRGAQVRGKGRQAVGEVKRVGKEAAYDVEHPRRPAEPDEPRA
ncbi:MAG TPA: CsbD family protein [Candidatus Dormibacteraeota bacterium]|jgi:uncharacterized protein YjbJ (UPF0337 family)